VWCYRQDLLDTPEVDEGGIVDVVDGQKNPIGQAFYARSSPLALRLLSRKVAKEEVLDEAFFKRRLDAALERRNPLKGRDGLRLVHGESDQLPGFFVDRYGDALVVQTLSEGANARKLGWARYLAEKVGARIVVCRDDASGRDFEGLAREKRVLWGDGPVRVTFHEGPHTLDVDLLEDMKTGSFLDQVDNHLRAAQLGRGEGLDLFSYHGGFALALSGVCTSVLAIEQDPVAAKRAAENARANGKANVEVREANAFDILHGFDKEGRKFDTIVVDPPGLAKRKQGVEGALRAYRELNLRALKCLRPEGLLVTCSCSGRVSREDFESMLVSASHDAKRQVQVLERRGAGLDHPALAGLPETEYLKAFYLRVL
jgi:23S rRNA (cytosine1962-C5)-methyltransferase